MIKKLIAIFFLAFVFNFIWENAHSCLYAHYQGGTITQIILLRATLFDALIITVLGLLFLIFNFFKKRMWLVVTIAVIFAIVLEIYALKTGRWEYNHFMPLIPIVNTGLTPTIQLGLLSYIIFKICDKIKT